MLIKDSGKIQELLPVRKTGDTWSAGWEAALGNPQAPTHICCWHENIYILFHSFIFLFVHSFVPSIIHLCVRLFISHHALLFVHVRWVHLVFWGFI